LNRFRGNAKFATWLFPIAMNESFMKLRKQRSNREQFLDSDTCIHTERSNSRLLHDCLKFVRLGYELRVSVQYNRDASNSSEELAEVATRIESGVHPARHRGALSKRYIRNAKPYPHSRNNPPFSSKASITRRTESIFQEPSVKRTYSQCPLISVYLNLPLIGNRQRI